MIIITKDNIYNYLTEKDIDIIDETINNKTYFKSLYELIEDNRGKIIYNESSLIS